MVRSLAHCWGGVHPHSQDNLYGVWVHLHGSFDLSHIDISMYRDYELHAEAASSKNCIHRRFNNLHAAVVWLLVGADNQYLRSNPTLKIYLSPSNRKKTWSTPTSAIATNHTTSSRRANLDAAASCEAPSTPPTPHLPCAQFLHLPMPLHSHPRSAGVLWSTIRPISHHIP